MNSTIFFAGILSEPGTDAFNKAQEIAEIGIIEMEAEIEKGWKLELRKKKSLKRRKEKKKRKREKRKRYKCRRK